MEWLKRIAIPILAIAMAGCGDQPISSFDNHRINDLMVQVDENDPAFVAKGIEFDEVVTWAGHRTLDGQEERYKMKLFYYGDRVRGYYNLSDRDDKNLQVFGRYINDMWVLKSVTKINTEEADGYIILSDSGEGIWSNGKVNFKKGTIALTKMNRDYNTLNEW